MCRLEGWRRGPIAGQGVGGCGASVRRGAAGLVGQVAVALQARVRLLLRREAVRLCGGRICRGAAPDLRSGVRGGGGHLPPEYAGADWTRLERRSRSAGRWYLGIVASETNLDALNVFFVTLPGNLLNVRSAL